MEGYKKQSKMYIFACLLRLRSSYSDSGGQIDERSSHVLPG